MPASPTSRRAGFFKLVQPERWGACRRSDAVLRAVPPIASACGSTGWAGGILGVHNWHLAQFDQRAQEDVWGGTPACESLVLRPMGAGVMVDGGCLVQRHVALVVRLRPPPEPSSAAR